MLRVVLAVLLAVALLAAAAPAVEDARADRTRALAEGELSRLSERTTGLAAAEETGPGAVARRTVSLSLPTGLAASPLSYVAVGGVPASEASGGASDSGSGGGPACDIVTDTAHGDVVGYRLDGGEPRVRHVPVDLRAVTGGTVRDDDEPLVLHGDARLTLSLVDRDGTRTVLVERTDGGARSETTGSRGAASA